VTIYKPKPLKRVVSDSICNIAHGITNSNVVFVIGAGVSKASPTNLPLGQEITTSVTSKLPYTSLACCITAALDNNLLSIADAAEANSAESLRLLQKIILELFDFKTAPPNYAHRCISLLMAEGKLKVMTTNWDNCIEREAVSTYCDLIACRQPSEIGETGNSAMLLKLHGCATIEGSIKVSSTQVNEVWWAGHQLAVAVESGQVVFLGIGSVAQYLKETIKRIIELSREPLKIKVVDICRSDDWDSLLPKHATDFYIPLSAEEFLDDVISSSTMNQMLAASELAREITQHNNIERIDLNDSVSQVIDFIGVYPSHYLWLWVRRGVFPAICCGAVLESNFVRYIIAMALIHNISPLQSVQLSSNVVSIVCKDFLFELAWAKDPLPAYVLCERKRESLIGSRRDNTLPSGLPCLIVVNDPSGPLPGPTITEESVVDTPNPDNLIDGPETIAPRWISLDNLLTVRTKDELRQLLGV